MGFHPHRDVNKILHECRLNCATTASGEGMIVLQAVRRGDGLSQSHTDRGGRNVSNLLFALVWMTGM
jgi:hypothetical protein